MNSTLIATAFAVCHTSRPDAPRPQTSVDMLGIMDRMDMLHRSNKVTIKRDGSVIPLGDGEGPSHH